MTVLTVLENETELFAARDLIAEILPDKITILAEAVEWPEEIDKNRAEEARIRAERKLEAHAGDGSKAELALKRSVLRIRMAEKEGK